MLWRMNEGAPRRHGMAQRVAFVAIASASAGGLVATLLAIVAVDQLVVEHADQRLRSATLTLAGELDEERDERRVAEGAGVPALTDDSVSETLDDENQEIESSGIRLGVFSGGQLIAGRAVPLPPSGSCVTLGVVGSRVRACSRPHGEWTLVAAQPNDAARLRGFYLAAALLGVALGAGGGALLSRWLTRWAVEPLTSLTRGLARSRPESGEPADLGPASDCEEVEAIRDELLRLIERTRVLLDQAQRFVANAAHELRTPLTTLRTELELHAEDASDSTRTVLQRACERVARLSELIERLLVLALPPEKLRHAFAAVSVAELIQEVAADAPEAAGRLRLELAGEGLVRGDVELLRSLVANALGNALKFAPHGSIDVQLRENGDVSLSVQDEGPGIPAELRERVFEPFYRVAANSTAGHGIGLALIGHIATVHGGSARFEDAALGARLVVTLPAWRAASTGG